MAGPVKGNARQQVATRYRPMAEINVTPFVDVMLVLLVVFMVTAPLLTVGVEVDLPESHADTLPGSDEPLIVTIAADGKLFLQELEIPIEELVPKLRAITGERPDARIFVRGDKTIEYGAVMTVMGTVNAAGFNKVALVTETPVDGESGS